MLKPTRAANSTTIAIQVSVQSLPLSLSPSFTSSTTGPSGRIVAESVLESGKPSTLLLTLPSSALVAATVAPAAILATPSTAPVAESSSPSPSALSPAEASPTTTIPTTAIPAAAIPATTALTTTPIAAAAPASLSETPSLPLVPTPTLSDSSSAQPQSTGSLSSDSPNGSITQIIPEPNPDPPPTPLPPAPLPTNSITSGSGRNTSGASKASNSAPLVGGVIAGCSGLVVIVGLLLFFLRSRRKRNGSGSSDASGSVGGGYYQFDRDNLGPTNRSARIKTAIGWRLDRTRDTISSAKRKVFTRKDPLSASTDRENSRLINSYQGSIGSTQRFDFAKPRTVGWPWGPAKRKRALISTPEMSGALVNPPVANPPILPPIGINSPPAVDFSQLLLMEERERRIQLERDLVERELASAQPDLERSPSATRQPYLSQPGITVPQRASHRRSSTVGIASWYDRERSRRFRSDPFDLEGFETGFSLRESQESNRQSGAGDIAGLLVRQSVAAGRSPRDSTSSRYSVGSYYRDQPRNSQWTDDRRWSLSSARMPSAPGMAL